MTLRAVIIGFVLSIFIAGVTYFNDNVIKQTYLVGYFLPVAIFGILIILAIFINPLLKKFTPKLAFKPLEIITIIALGISICGWPGSSYSRIFTSVITMPGQQYPSKTNWQTAKVLSYVPGGSATLAIGFVKDWNQLAKDIVGSGNGQNAVSKSLFAKMTDENKELYQSILNGATIGQSERTRMLDAINIELADRALFSDEVYKSTSLPRNAQLFLVKKQQGAISDWEMEHLNRAIIDASMSNVILPMPKGKGVLLDGGNPLSSAAAPLMQGWSGKEKPTLMDLPWKAWAPVLLFWGSISLMLVLACLCIVIIVQPQWKRELLPYPIARFVHEITEEGEKGFLPKIAQSKLFWYGLAIAFSIDLINTLFKWFPKSINIPMQLPFTSLFSVVDPVFMGETFFVIAMPLILPTVIAFTFFLNTQVSFSVGISALSYALVYTILYKYGISVSNNEWDIANFSMLRFGAYMGSAVMIFYLGRKYYLSVLGSAVGIKNKEVPPMVAWMMRIVFVLFIGICWLLVNNSLDWPIAIAAIFFILMAFLVLTRIVAETGLFFIQFQWFLPAALAMIFGIQSLGPVGFFMISIIAVVFAGDVRETFMPFLANAVYAVTDKDKLVPRKGIVWLFVILVIVGFGVAMGSSLLVQYTKGLDLAGYGAGTLTSAVMDNTSNRITELTTFNELNKSMNVHGFDHVLNMKPMKGVIGWAALGLVLVIVTSVLRTSLPWWPIHPIMFILWGTFIPSKALGFSILLGWLIKLVVVRFSGAKGYHSVKPFMAGVIGGELTCVLLWNIIGAIYYFSTGIIPKSMGLMGGWN